MYKNLAYFSIGLGPETYHSPQGQGQEAPLTPVRVTPTICVTPGGGTNDFLQAIFNSFLGDNCGHRLSSSDADPPLYIVYIGLVLRCVRS